MSDGARLPAIRVKLIAANARPSVITNSGCGNRSASEDIGSMANAYSWRLLPPSPSGSAAGSASNPPGRNERARCSPAHRLVSFGFHWSDHPLESHHKIGSQRTRTGDYRRRIIRIPIIFVPVISIQIIVHIIEATHDHACSTNAPGRVAGNARTTLPAGTLGGSRIVRLALSGLAHAARRACINSVNSDSTWFSEITVSATCSRKRLR
jgi:hypothetical protein